MTNTIRSTTRLVFKLLTIGLIIATTTTHSWASTTNQRILILAAEAMKNGQWKLTVRGLMGNKISLDSPSTIIVKKNPNIFLDGKAASAQAAFVAGHSFRHQADNAYYECYSSDFHFPAKATTSEYDGVYHLTLRNAGKVSIKTVKKDQEIITSKHYDLHIHLEIAAEKIVAAGATGMFIKNKSITSMPIDTNKLAVQNGMLQGHIAVTFLSHGSQMPEPGIGKQTRTFSIQMKLSQQNMTGTYNDAANSNIQASWAPIPDRSSNCTLWFAYQSPLGLDEPIDIHHAVKHGLVSIRLKDGQLQDGYHSKTKAYADSSITTAKLNFSGNTIEGSLETAAGKNKKRIITVSGQLVGHQFFGTCSVDDTSGGRIRGGIRLISSPPFICWPESLAKRWLAENPNQIIPADMLLP